ncbi:uncharacterized protein LOC131631811 [Vicia villosa]|uniref:uncharacterized protein LOC131631811 n=1 Tax=Vicia villosa TaxID=3911 RepID=UPI00273C856D|nr:uncharacterized protein LOC131631811 [Vicia villosa]
MVAGRNDDAIVDALRMLAGSLGQVPQANAGNRNGDDDEECNLVLTCWKRKLRIGGAIWLKGFNEEGIQVTWDRFLDAFLENYFPEDCRGKKEVEFLELKQGNGTVAEHDIKKAIGYQQITRFAELVNKSRIHDEDSRESASHYKAINEKKGQYRGKAYDNKKKVGFGGKPSGGGSSAPIKCFKCCVEGHRVVDCPKVEATCFKMSTSELKELKSQLEDLLEKKFILPNVSP